MQVQTILLSEVKQILSRYKAWKHVCMCGKAEAEIVTKTCADDRAILIEKVAAAMVEYHDSLLPEQEAWDAFLYVVNSAKSSYQYRKKMT